jgi:hypothetical protein
MSFNQKPLNNHPAGMENYDNGALNDFQQNKTNQNKVKILIDLNFFFQKKLIFVVTKIQSRIENEKYLREHPEIKLLISDFLK